MGHNDFQISLCPEVYNYQGVKLDPVQCSGTFSKLDVINPKSYKDIGPLVLVVVLES